MDKTATLKVSELSPEARQRLAEILHVPLADADELLVTLPRQGEGSSPAQRFAARERLLDLLHRLDERTAAVDDADVEAAVEEAMQFVRPRD